RRSGFENPARRAPRLPEAARKRKVVAVLQRHGGQRDDFHAGGGFYGFLVHLFGRNKQGHGATAFLKVFGNRQTRKQMPAGAAAGDGDEGRVGSGYSHVALA